MRFSVGGGSFFTTVCFISGNISLACTDRALLSREIQLSPRQCLRTSRLPVRCVLWLVPLLKLLSWWRPFPMRLRNATLRSAEKSLVKYKTIPKVRANVHHAAATTGGAFRQGTASDVQVLRNNRVFALDESSLLSNLLRFLPLPATGPRMLASLQHHHSAHMSHSALLLTPVSTSRTASSKRKI